MLRLQDAGALTVVTLACVSSKVLLTYSRVLVHGSSVSGSMKIVDWPAGGRTNPLPGQSGLARLDPLAACAGGGRIDPRAA